VASGGLDLQFGAVVRDEEVLYIFEHLDIGQAVAYFDKH